MSRAVKSGLAALLGGLALLPAVAALASGPARPPQPTVSALTTAVGPAGVTPVAPASARRPAPAGGSASQVVSGTVSSVTGVAVGSSGQPIYRGTEPASMTVSRAGRVEIVTLVPR